LRNCQDDSQDSSWLRSSSFVQMYNPYKQVLNRWKLVYNRNVDSRPPLHWSRCRDNRVCMCDSNGQHILHLCIPYRQLLHNQILFLRHMADNFLHCSTDIVRRSLLDRAYKVSDNTARNIQLGNPCRQLPQTGMLVLCGSLYTCPTVQANRCQPDRACRYCFRNLYTVQLCNRHRRLFHNSQLALHHKDHIHPTEHSRRGQSDRIYMCGQSDQHIVQLCNPCIQMPQLWILFRRHKVYTHPTVQASRCQSHMVHSGYGSRHVALSDRSYISAHQLQTISLLDRAGTHLPAIHY
jgi:hypothetical protein